MCSQCVRCMTKGLSSNPFLQLHHDMEYVLMLTNITYFSYSQTLLPSSVRAKSRLRDTITQT